MFQKVSDRDTRRSGKGERGEEEEKVNGGGGVGVQIRATFLIVNR